MQILKFQFEDKSEGWRLNETTFNDPLTLLVGASGVGKTLILRSLKLMKLIVEGNSYKGAEWNIEYVADDGARHTWGGAFLNRGLSDSNWREQDSNRNKYSQIEHERLTINGQDLVIRDTDGISFKEKSISLKLSPQESIFKLFREEEQIKPAYEGICKMDYTDHTFSAGSNLKVTRMNHPIFVDLAASLSKKPECPDCLTDIRNSDFSLASRLYLVQKYHQDTFNLIQSLFIKIFPQVTGIKSDVLEDNDNNLLPHIKEGIFVQIQEEGVHHWIWPNRISSGMYRTLMQLCDLYLCPDGTVFLIDEFENSLGINCMDEITEAMVAQDRPLQFIVTSHHPYIINKIPPRYWKLVTRNGGEVRTHSLADLGCDFSKSKHENFMQLMQLDEFHTGQEQEIAGAGK